MQILFVLKLLPSNFSIHQWILSATYIIVMFAWWCCCFPVCFLRLLIEILFWGIIVSLPPFTYLFDYLFIAVWTHQYLLYSMGLNSVLSLFQFVPALATRDFCRLTPVFFQQAPLFFLSLTFPYFLTLENVPGLSCISPAPTLESNGSP